MRYVSRKLRSELKKAARAFPALILTGPRRAGKTTLLGHLFPKADYVLLEDPDLVARATADPQGFLDELKLPAILDEIQNVPVLFNYIRSRIDKDPRRKGQWLLTGSQEAPLMRGVTESMAGRIAVFQLLPFSVEEYASVSPFLGGFPEVLDNPSTSDIWFRSYIQTYLERDVRNITAVKDLATFRRFLAILASRCGQVLNKTDIAAPLGVSVPTITDWLSILEITGQIILAQPFYENFGKRLIKSPKLYFMDSGLVCHLLGIRDKKTLTSSPFADPVFESFVASEVIKYRLNRGRERGLYCFRDRQGLEVDFVVDEGNRELTFIEAKATRTPTPDDATSLIRLVGSVSSYGTRAFLVHAGAGRRAELTTLCRGVKAVGLDRLDDVL